MNSACLRTVDGVYRGVVLVPDGLGNVGGHSPRVLPPTLPNKEGVRKTGSGGGVER